jgi:bromodomain-containing factor 1
VGGLAESVENDSVVPTAPLTFKLNIKAIQKQQQQQQQQQSPAKSASSLVNPNDKRMKALDRLLIQTHAYWFLEPVPLNLPNYFDIVKYPMDLGTVKKNLEQGKYSSNSDFASDVRLVFANAMLYNDRSTQVHLDALSLSIQFEKEFGGKLKDLPSVAIQEHAPPAPRPKPTTSAVPTTVNQLEKAHKVLGKLLDSNHSALFRYPVDGEMYPSYYSIISNPIDLQAIKKRLATSEYTSFQDFHNDMTLLITNIFTFNRKGTFGFAAGEQFQNLYQRLIKVGYFVIRIFFFADTFLSSRI